MVFSSVPLFLDPPNWQQHTNYQGNENQHVGMGGGGGSSAPPNRPISMAEKARVAKIPAPEAPLKCPRCESSNTKFCYFNNYSLAQPRHFCKTCRRYWTRGGALRTVPVGGGCRRNKRSSGTKSSTTSAASNKSSSTSVGDQQLSSSALIPPSSFMASLQNIAMGNLGLTFGGSLLGGGLDEFNGSHLLSHHHHQQQQQQQQHPSFLGGFEMPGGGGVYGDEIKSDNMNSQLTPVKMEDSHGGLSLAKQLMGISSSSHHHHHNQQTPSHEFWGANIIGNNSNMWRDLSGINSNSNSTTHLL